MRDARLWGKDAPARSAETDLRIGLLTIDCSHFTVLVEGRAMPLTRLEFDLLRYLVANADRVVDSIELMATVVGGVHQAGSSLVRVHICRLRTKLGRVRNSIQTVRGRGFWFDARYTRPCERLEAP